MMQLFYHPTSFLLRPDRSELASLGILLDLGWFTVDTYESFDLPNGTTTELLLDNDEIYFSRLLRFSVVSDSTSR